MRQLLEQLDPVNRTQGRAFIRVHGHNRPGLESSSRTATVAHQAQEQDPLAEFRRPEQCAFHHVVGGQAQAGALATQHILTPGCPGRTGGRGVARSLVMRTRDLTAMLLNMPFRLAVFALLALGAARPFPRTSFLCGAVKTAVMPKTATP